MRHPRPLALALWVAAGAVAAAISLFAFQGPGRPSATRTGTAFPFPCLEHETVALHVHPWLRIVIDGQPVTVPAGIGIPRALSDARGVVHAGACFQPLHTHDASGIVHVEGPDPAWRYTLGDFFRVWRATYPNVAVGGHPSPIDYTRDDLLGFRADAAHAIRLVVDGRPSSDGSQLVLNALDYCRAGVTVPPCWPTAAADPFPPALARAYGTGHTILLEYRAR